MANDLESMMDPRVMLVLAVAGLGKAAYDKLRAIWKANGVSDERIDAIIAEAEGRIARIDAEAAADSPPPVA